MKRGVLKKNTTLFYTLNSKIDKNSRVSHRNSGKCNQHVGSGDR